MQKARRLNAVPWASNEEQSGQGRLFTPQGLKGQGEGQIPEPATEVLVESAA